MVSLAQLGLADREPHGERVAILVGPNGSGKSNFLKDLAVAVRAQRRIAVISNTPYDRFVGVRGINRISASNGGNSPKGVIKRAVARTIDEPDSRFYQTGAILDYCGYEPRFGFRVDGRRPELFAGHTDTVDRGHPGLEASLAFLQRHDGNQLVWIDQRDSTLSFSLSREFAAVLRNEDLLRKERYLKDIEVYLQRRDGTVIELLHASSGELALISSLIFLVTTLEADPVVLIDEPENSLHPSWQREYVDKVLAAAAYRNATIIIATHAPLVVTGALANASDLVSIFQVRGGEPERLNVVEGTSSSGNIEEILWRAFDVITPANHFVSQSMVGVVTKLERGEIGRQEALAAVNAMDDNSFDDSQRRFFGAVRELIGEVESERQRNVGSDE